MNCVKPQEKSLVQAGVDVDHSSRKGPIRSVAYSVEVPLRQDLRIEVM